jgi:predicted dithiol-disulfide oxidoreductase (DUF899 family)
MSRQGTADTTRNHSVVTHEEWLASRVAFLAKEKDFTRLRDQLSRERRELPWERVERPYSFDGPKGKETLAELFEKRSQLIVYHFMFSPEASEGCKHCSFWADHYDGMQAHLNHRDVTFVAISRAPLAKLDAFKRRMGWRFTWVSSAGSSFNYDFQASFTPEEMKSGTALYNFVRTDPDMPDREGISVFYKDERGAVYHTYSAYARGIDMVNATYQFLDLVPKGRDEGSDFPQDWVAYHDRYER